jgi:hypothetical protein
MDRQRELDLLVALHLLGAWFDGDLSLGRVPGQTQTGQKQTTTYDLSDVSLLIKEKSRPTDAPFKFRCPPFFIRTIVPARETVRVRAKDAHTRYGP